MNDNSQNQRLDISQKEQSGLKDNRIAGNKFFHSKLFIVSLVIIFFSALLLLRVILSANEVHSASIEAAAAVHAGNYDKAITIYTGQLKKHKDNKSLLIGAIQAIALKGNETGQEHQSFEQIKPYIGDLLKTESNN